VSTKDSVVLAQAIDRHAPADSTPAMPLEAVPYAPPAPNLSRAALRSLIGVALAVLAVALIMGIAPRVERAATLRAEATEIKSRVPRVTVAKPRRSTATSNTLLPGTVDALQETTIYARTNGYLKRWLVDIGDVREGGTAPRRDRDARARPGASPGASHDRSAARAARNGGSERRSRGLELPAIQERGGARRDLGAGACRAAGDGRYRPHDRRGREGRQSPPVRPILRVSRSSRPSPTSWRPSQEPSRNGRSTWALW